MKNGHLSIFAILAMMFGTSVYAADNLAVKAPAVAAPVCTLQGCSGWYAGMGLTGIGTNANIIGNGIGGSIFAAGGEIDVHGGYQFWNGTYFAAAEVGIGNVFQPNQSLSTLGKTSITGYEIVKLGYGLQGLFNVSTAPAAGSQAPTAINIPASLAQSLISPYILMGAQQRAGISQWINGAGAEFLLASQWNADLRYTYASPTGGLPSDNKVTLGLNYHFK